jgi:hypothetical protein
MCIELNIVKKPNLGSEQVIGMTAMGDMIKALPIAWLKDKVTDSYYYCPSWEGWAKAIEYLKPKVPKYLRDKFDCENFAGWFRIRMAELFGINTMAEVEGWADCRGRGMERHGWNIFTDGKFFYQMESQNGVVMDIDDPAYVPDEITMG